MLHSEAHNHSVYHRGALVEGPSLTRQDVLIVSDVLSYLLLLTLGFLEQH